ncbi:FHA domain-containing protein [Actinoplanes utahensis]|uniref:Serine/threonine protein kinase n=1 Tax=Actinoplanes utahensis TaxID=1869 RepID=A0A0A6X2I1_ACTUT|nr:FHA domain-containing protein [Actinoplanes utahensis]KHD74277.1 serine/threonine protein kinase [Actinoplanes utahensis]GIF31560.1 hypothetical protein Aut01nite_45460 [Actinoplanes utahensis]
MSSVLVQLPAGAGSVELAPGQSVTFGRADRAGIVLPHPGVSRLAGRITATADHWLIDNLSSERTYVIDNPEGGGEHLKIAPRRLGAPVPFEFARLSIPVDDGTVEFLVFAPDHAFADPAADPEAAGAATVAAFSLDEAAKYFLILVALCEPRLRDGSSVAIPLVPEVADRLGLTRSAVNFHIDYLADHKLRIRRRAGAQDSRREAVVSVALRFNLVTDQHLRLLPPRTP